jgi:hypothetical protein
MRDGQRHLDYSKFWIRNRNIMTKTLPDPCGSKRNFGSTRIQRYGNNNNTKTVFHTWLVPVYPIQTSHLIKGSVQRKLSWVENGVNRSVQASDCGAGHSFVGFFGFHLGFAIFPVPVSTVQFIGEFWINRWSGESDVVPIELALYTGSCHSYYYWRWVAFGANRRSGGMLAAPKGEAGRIRSANKKF